jgi:hypothetical protein
MNSYKVGCFIVDLPHAVLGGFVFLASGADEDGSTQRVSIFRNAPWLLRAWSGRKKVSRRRRPHP